MAIVMGINDSISNVFADVIIYGSSTIDDVPEFGRDGKFRLRDRVKEILIERGREDLTHEKESE